MDSDFEDLDDSDDLESEFELPESEFELPESELEAFLDSFELSLLLPSLASFISRERLRVWMEQTGGPVAGRPRAGAAGRRHQLSNQRSLDEPTTVGR